MLVVSCDGEVLVFFNMESPAKLKHEYRLLAVDDGPIVQNFDDSKVHSGRLNQGVLSVNPVLAVS